VRVGPESLLLNGHACTCSIGFGDCPCTRRALGVGVVELALQLSFFFAGRESTDQSYQLLRDSLDLYLAMYPDNVQHLMLQARLYFHLGIWPEKVLRHSVVCLLVG